MTDGWTLSDAAALWYSRGNPTHLHCPIRLSTAFFLLLISLLFFFEHVLTSTRQCKPECSDALMRCWARFGKYFGMIEQWQLYFHQINLSKYKHRVCAGNCSIVFCFFNVKLSEETNTDNKQCFAKGKCHQTTFRSLSCIIYFNYSLHAATGQEFPPGVNEGSICCNTAERQQLQIPNRKLLLSLTRDKADKQGSLKGE